MFGGSLGKFIDRTGSQIDRGVRRNIPGGWGGAALGAAGGPLVAQLLAAGGMGGKNKGPAPLGPPASSGVVPPQMQMQRMMGSPYQQLMSYLFPQQRMMPGMPGQMPGQMGGLGMPMGGPPNMNMGLPPGLAQMLMQRQGGPNSLARRGWGGGVAY